MVFDSRDNVRHHVIAFLLCHCACHDTQEFLFPCSNMRPYGFPACKHWSWSTCNTCARLLQAFDHHACTHDLVCCTAPDSPLQVPSC